MAQGSDTTIAQRIALEGGQEILRQLAELGKAGEAAFKQMQDAANASGSPITPIESSLSRVINSFRGVGTAFAPVGAAVAELGVRFREFGESVLHVADNVFPHFKEIALLSVGAAAAEIVHLADSAASSVRETENQAAAFGLTAEAVEAAKFVFAKAGVENEKFATGMARLTRFLGEGRIEQQKLTGAMSAGAEGVQVLRGSIGTAGSAVATLRGGIANLASEIESGVKVIRGSAQLIPDFSTAGKSLTTLGVEMARFKDNSEGQLAAIEALAKGFEKLTPSQQAIEGAKIFGRGWADIVAALRDFGPEMKKATANLLSLGLEEAERKQAHFFNASRALLELYVDRVKVIIGGSLGQAFVPVFDEISSALKANGTAIREWATAAGENLKLITRDIIGLFSGKAPETDFGKGFVKAKDQIVGAIGVIKDAFTGLMTAFDGIAKASNSLFGTNFSGGALAAGAAIFYLVGGFGALASGMRVVIAAGAAFEVFVAFLSGGALLTAATAVARLGVALAGASVAAAPWIALSVGIAAVGAALALLFVPLKDIHDAIASVFGDGAAQVFDDFVAKATEIFAAFAEVWNQTWAEIAANFNRNLSAILGQWTAATEGIKAAWSSVADWIAGKVTDILGFLQGLIDKAIAAANAIASAMSGGGGSSGGQSPDSAIIPGNAAGGLIRGPGTGTSDSILSWLSNREFVVNAAATARNLPLLHLINSGFRLPSFALGGLVDAIQGMSIVPGFASGGLVAAAAASAGQSGSGGGGAGGGAGAARFNLHFGREVVAVETDAETVGRIERHARFLMITSGGRKPSHVG